MIKSNVTRNEMKTAHKINKEGKKKKKKKVNLKAHIHKQQIGPIKKKSKFNSHKGEKVINK